ncbi:hypothetical protein BGZ54_007758 [Gamsiella multidivaricata]|nr:hypothetical protein BGZ54_007758 [Gamsiella multidivaricata]
MSYSSQLSGHSNLSYGGQYQEQHQRSPSDHSYRDQHTGEQYLPDRSTQNQAKPYQHPDNQYQESPRTTQRTQRRRDQPGNTATTEDTKLHSLDDYEAMLQKMTSPGLHPTKGSRSMAAAEEPTLDDYEAMLYQMTSPNLGPKEPSSRSAPTGARRPEREVREARAERIARQNRRQQQKEQPQQHDGQEQAMVEPRQRQRQQQHPVDSQLDPLQNSGTDQTFEERKLKRRSSLPGKLKESPNMFAGIQRRSSGQHLSPTAVEVHAESSKLQSLIENTMHFTQEHPQNASSQQDHSQLPALQRKRFSWENESIAPRADLLQSNTERPGSLQRKGSWQDVMSSGETQEQHQHQQRQEMTSDEHSLRPQQNSSRPPLSTKSNLRLSDSTPYDNSDQANAMLAADNNNDMSTFRSHSPATLSEQTASTNNIPSRHHAGAPPPLAPRPVTPNSRSRPSTPLGNIRPPPGPAPPSAAMGAAPALTRKASPRSKKRTGSGSSANNVMLQPSLQGSRPRAGSTASVNSLTFTPPPPSSPLPSLPPSQPSQTTASPLNHAGEGIGLGLSDGQLPPQSRKISGGNKDLALPPPQSFVHQDDQVSLLTPASSLPMTPEMDAAASLSSSGTNVNQTAHLARLKKRVSILEKELAQTETELNSRIRDGSELQHRVEQLTAERDALEKKLAMLSVESHGPAAIMSPASSIRGGNDDSRTSFQLDRASLELMRVDELKQAVLQVQDEKDVLFEAMMERQDRSRSEMADQMENIRAELKERDEEISRLRADTVRNAQHSTASSTYGNESQNLGQEVARLMSVQTGLEQELAEARAEIRRLQALVDEKEQRETETLHDLELKAEALRLLTHEHEQRKQDHEHAYSELEQEIHALRSERSQHEEYLSMREREVEAFHARSQQEAVQYQTLQDSVQRLSSKMARLESQHANELQQIHINHEAALERTLLEHDHSLNDLAGRHKAEKEALVERTRRQVEESFNQDRVECDAREKVLRDRILEQSTRNDQLEEELFRVQKALETAHKEKEALARTNRSLERHLSMQHLQEQENMYRTEELERENVRLRALLSDLDLATAAAARRDSKDSDGSAEQEGDDKSWGTRGVEMFEQKHRKWAEQVELMAQKLARAEEEARKTMEQNEELRVALELAQSSSLSPRFKRHSFSFRPTTPSTPTSSRVLSPPLSASSV